MVTPCPFRAKPWTHIQHINIAQPRLLNVMWVRAAGLVKRFSFDVLDSEVLHATVDPDAYPTVVVAEAAELDKWVRHLHSIRVIRSACVSLMCGLRTRVSVAIFGGGGGARQVG